MDDETCWRENSIKVRVQCSNWTSCGWELAREVHDELTFN